MTGQGVQGRLVGLGFSEAVALKGERLASVVGAVQPMEGPLRRWEVRSARESGKTYRVGVQVTEDGLWWESRCSCQHGRAAGGGARCYHVAGVLCAVPGLLASLPDEQAPLVGQATPTTGPDSTPAPSDSVEIDLGEWGGVEL